MTTSNAVKWLENHYQTILGTTDSGVCVLEQATKLLPNGDVVGNDITVWLPANINILSDWMNY